MTIPGLLVDPNGAVPVYRQIAAGIRVALSDGRLAAGDRLPPTRDLARQIGVNRNTVVSAYDLLVEEGIAESHTGRGTFIVSRGAAGATPTDSAGDAWFTAFSRAVEGPAISGLLAAYRVATSDEGISFAGSYPAPDLMPVEAFRRAADRVLRERGASILGYGPPGGLPALRERIADDMTASGSPVRADDILIANGSQQALDIVFRTLLDRGEAIVVEDPTYTGALGSLASLGARLVGVPLDEDGIRPDLLEIALERHRARVIYLQPTFHNPATRVMSPARRREVLEIVERRRCVVVEDDWARDLRFEGRDLPTLHALDDGRHVIYVSTFSKKLLPGIRVGWIAAPEPVFPRILALKQIDDHGTSLLVQAALDAFLADGSLGPHLERVRAAYRQRRDRMVEALTSHLPEGTNWGIPEGGLFLWVNLPDEIDARELSSLAARRGVLVTRGEVFHVEGGGRCQMRLTFSSAPPHQIEAGIALLGEVVRERWPEARTEPRAAEREAVPIL